MSFYSISKPVHNVDCVQMVWQQKSNRASDLLHKNKVVYLHGLQLFQVPRAIINSGLAVLLDFIQNREIPLHAAITLLE